MFRAGRVPTSYAIAFVSLVAAVVANLVDLDLLSTNANLRARYNLKHYAKVAKLELHPLLLVLQQELAKVLFTIFFLWRQATDQEVLVAEELFVNLEL